ncbi:hypothetical protein BD414DRAFT_492335 [Trametes punicea]|nr:hypothetical protein BD414DRAFT_492335 [Trametes punicea]
MPGSAEEFVVGDFAVVLFSILGYARRHIVAITRKEIPSFAENEASLGRTYALSMASRTTSLFSFKGPMPSRRSSLPRISADC